MSPAHVRARVRAVAKLGGDAERAHAAEDDLYHEVLEAIATGQCLDPKVCAAAALETAKLAFPRWYA